MSAEIVMLIGSASCFLLTIYWVRKRVLREKYAFYWILLASMILAIGAFPDVIKSIAVNFHLSLPATFLMINFAMFYVITFAASLSQSKQYKRGIKLTQEIALLTKRIDDLEKKITKSNQDD